HIFPFALADTRGTWMYDSHGSNGNLVPFGVAGELPPAGRTLVYAMTLDDLLAEQDRVDAVKIDIEGAEYMALKGGTKLLARCRPVIFSEFSPPALQSISAKSGCDYLAFLRSLNYEFRVLRPDEEELDVGTDIHRVLNIFESRHSTHIDIVAVPQ